MKYMLDFYLQTMKIAILASFQYRVGEYFYMIGMIAEPVIYLVVWSTVAQAQGGMVGGYTPGGFAAYYIVWTLVRNINIVFTPYGWEWRIQRGELSAMLLRPLHPLHYDLAYFAGEDKFDLAAADFLIHFHCGDQFLAQTSLHLQFCWQTSSVE